MSLLIGVLAAHAALSGETTGTQGALQEIVQAPFGPVLLGALAVGLVGHALGRFIEDRLDTERKGTDGKGIITRSTYVNIGLLSAGLAISTVRVMLGAGGGGSGEAETQGWTDYLLVQPFGQWLVGIVGVVVIGIGMYQYYEAYCAKLREELNLAKMSAYQHGCPTR